MNGGGEEKRRFGRITLDHPLPAMINNVPVEVVELSVVGFRVAHEARFPPGFAAKMKVTWDAHELEFAVTVIRSTLFHLAKTAGEPTIYHSGVQIDQSAGGSEKLLRDLISERVIRALEQQKENARGVPPIGKYTYIVGKGDRYRRCVWDGQRWRRFESTQSNQPPVGFTISAEVDLQQVELLCRTYEATNDEGRRLTQILAQLSISKREGAPTRRYVP